MKCEYCGSEYHDSIFHPGTCAECGAPNYIVDGLEFGREPCSIPWYGSLVSMSAQLNNIVSKEYLRRIYGE